jgi:pimeloyl-ACP methyl ester carboxylesterase
VSAAEATYLTADGASLWYELKGRGPGLPVVLLDGLGCAGFIWRHLWEPLCATRQVLHSHYRGHGQSGVPTDDTRLGIEYCCDDLEAVMAHTGVQRAVVLGHSMGVQVALEFQKRYPSRVAGLVLICGSFGTPLDTWHDHTLLRALFPLMQGSVERWPGFARNVTQRLLTSELALQFGWRSELNPKLVPKAHFKPYMEHMAGMHPLYFVRTLQSLKDHSAWEHLPQVKVPSLVVGGEGDKFTPVWLSEKMAHALAQSEYLLVPGGTHTAPLERPGMVNAAVERLLVRAEAAAQTGARTRRVR